MTPIQSAIGRLADSATLTNLVGQRVFVAPGPQGVGRPYITVQLIDDAPLTTLSGWTGLGRALVQVDVWALGLAEAVDIAAVVRAEMLALTPDMVYAARRADFEADTRLHRVSQDFTFWYDETAPA